MDADQTRDVVDAEVKTEGKKANSKEIAQIEIEEIAARIATVVHGAKEKIPETAKAAEGDGEGGGLKKIESKRLLSSLNKNSTPLPHPAERGFQFLALAL